MSKDGLKKLVTDIQEISEHYRAKAAAQLNSLIIDERWEIGKRIVKEEQKGEVRAEYGTNLLKELLPNSHSNSVKDIALAHWLIIANSIFISPTERFCRCVCKISHGHIFRQVSEKRMRVPDGGISRKLHNRCGR